MPVYASGGLNLSYAFAAKTGYVKGAEMSMRRWWGESGVLRCVWGSGRGEIEGLTGDDDIVSRFS